MTLTNQIVSVLYKHDDIFLDFISSFLEIEVDQNNSIIERLQNYYSIDTYIYPFIIDNKYYIGLVPNSSKNMNINGDIYNHFNKVFEQEKHHHNIKEKYYLQLNVYDTNKNSPIEEIRKDKDNIIIIENLNKYRQLYYGNFKKFNNK